jgi:hypothetical protein
MRNINQSKINAYVPFLCVHTIGVRSKAKMLTVLCVLNIFDSISAINHTSAFFICLLCVCMCTHTGVRDLDGTHSISCTIQHNCQSFTNINQANVMFKI